MSLYFFVEAEVLVSSIVAKVDIPCFSVSISLFLTASTNAVPNIPIRFTKARANFSVLS